MKISDVSPNILSPLTDRIWNGSWYSRPPEFQRNTLSFKSARSRFAIWKIRKFFIRDAKPGHPLAIHFRCQCVDMAKVQDGTYEYYLLWIFIQMHGSIFFQVFFPLSKASCIEPSYLSLSTSFLCTYFKGQWKPNKDSRNPLNIILHNGRLLYSFALFIHFYFIYKIKFH